MKAAVFDLGGVLIDWNPRYFYKSVFADPAEMEHFLTRICGGAWNAVTDAGETFENAIPRWCEKFPDYARYISLFYSGWPQMLGGEIAPSVAALRALKQAKIPVYALTNWSAQTFPLARAKFPFFSMFDGIVVSGEEKLIKPDPRFFKLLLSRYGLRAQDCVFIDDNAVNVAAAQALGFAGLHLTEPAKIREQLWPLLGLRADA